MMFPKRMGTAALSPHFFAQDAIARLPDAAECVTISAIAERSCKGLVSTVNNLL